MMELVLFNVLFVAALFAPPAAVTLGGLSLLRPASFRRRQTAAKRAVPATL